VRRLQKNSAGRQSAIAGLLAESSDLRTQTAMEIKNLSRTKSSLE